MMNKSLIALALGTFAMGIAEFAIMGILTDVASAMDVSISRAGDFISAYAAGVAVGAPSLLLLSKYRIRSVLIFLGCVIAFGNLLCAVSQDYYTLLISRFISGLPHGAYFGTAAIAASRLVPRSPGCSGDDRRHVGFKCHRSSDHYPAHQSGIMASDICHRHHIRHHDRLLGTILRASDSGVGSAQYEK